MKTWVRWMSAGAVVALLLGTGACKTKWNSDGIMVESYPGNQVTVNSRVFGRWFEIVQVAVAKGGNGLLKTTITARNIKRECQVEYRLRWVDADGIEVAPDTASWIPAAVAQRGTLMMTGIAPSRQAADFILDMRFPSKSKRW